MHVRGGWLLSILLAFPAAAVAGPMDPPPELAKLGAFAGTWDCQERNGEGGRASRDRIEVKPALLGYWYEMTTAPVPPPRPGFEIRYDLTWDAAKKEYVQVLLGPGGWGTATSPGWEGDTIVWTGEMTFFDKRLRSRTTFTKQKDGSVVMIFETQDTAREKAPWKTKETVCKKAEEEP